MRTTNQTLSQPAPLLFFFYILDVYVLSAICFFQLDPMELNNTRKAKKEILFFNRVPKVGSQTTMELLKQLSVKNNFHYHKDKTQKVEQIKLPYSKEVGPYEWRTWNWEMPLCWNFQKWLANLVDFLNPPSAYVKHVNFVNFTQ